ncbi:BrxE family protein [Synechococcus sp. CCY 0621]|uniref:BrxE family protein n=1 Tax=Synechococcus sp. CCY 0621 TaxID=2815603 RepID=UPI001C2298CE|nr:BrxE family protein [Synechococcus sp. CCY 0621]
MNLALLFKLRLVVAALGGSQRLGWWNADVLTNTGEYLFKQGFHRSAPFAQTRAGFRAAQLACDEALAIQPSPGGPITCHLFRLTPVIEDAFENERNRWMDEPEAWTDTFQQAWALTPEQWPQALIDLAGLGADSLAWAREQTPQTAKALRLADRAEIHQGHLEKLAAGFLSSQPGQLVVPYLQVAD